MANHEVDVADLVQQNPKVQSPSYRVLMIAPTSFFADYGCHVRILEETRILQKMGHQVTVATYRNGNAVPGIQIERTLPIPWRTQYEVGSSRHKLVFDALLGWKTMQLLFRQRFDVIHAHLHEGALIGLILSRLFRIPMVFDFQGSLTEEMIDHHFLARDSILHQPMCRIEQWIDRSAPVVLTSTAHAERLLIERFGCDPDKILALPDCVDTDTFKPAAAFDAAVLAALRQRLGIPSDARVIVYLGLLAEYQGTSLLLEATQRILQTHPDVYLLLMGFPNVEFYRQQAVQLGIEEQVILTGRVPYVEAPQYVALGHVAAAPKLSLSEGSGKLLNYMAAALPTVVFDTPVAREYLGVHGLYAVRGDVESLAEKLSVALLAPELGLPLRQRAIQHFEWLRAGRQIEEAYGRLLGGKRAKTRTRTWQTSQE